MYLLKDPFDEANHYTQKLILRLASYCPSLEVEEEEEEEERERERERESGGGREGRYVL